MCEVIFPSFRVLQYVIKENKNKPTKIWAKKIIHKTLEGCGSVVESEYGTIITS